MTDALNTSDSARSVLNGKLLFPFIAPPNAGKGTQTQILANQYPLATFDMGSTFRAIMKDGADPEAKAELEKFINAGRLVPVETVAKVFKQHFEALAMRSPNAKGFILDGFPRSAEQAQVLEDLCKDWGAEVSSVIYLAVSNETVKQRATGRRFCSLNPLHIYNLENPKLTPQSCKVNAFDDKDRQIWVCDQDQAELIVRPDDEPEKVTVRLEEYTQGTEPLLEYFRKKDLLVEINGEQTPAEVSEVIQTHLNPVLKSRILPASSGSAV